MKTRIPPTTSTSSNVHAAEPFPSRSGKKTFFAPAQAVETPFFSKRPEPKPEIGQALSVQGNGLRIATKPLARQTTLKQISHAWSASNQHEVTPLFAGTPIVQNPPGGIRFIAGRSGGGGLGTAGGLTLRKNAAAFTTPVFTTTNRHQRTNGRNQHFATVQPTQTADVIHDSFYPGPGDHEFPAVAPALAGGASRYQSFYRISPALSNLIRQGEQEHLDDLQRAYELTYSLIARVINQISQREFGPANTPNEADQLAEQTLARLLPAALGSHPINWPRMLDRLLDMTETRDRQGWHSLSIGPPTRNGSDVIYPLHQEPTFRVGQVPSNQVVNYPRSP